MKAVALYRDGSKASQPLSALTDEAEAGGAVFREGMSPAEAYERHERPRFGLPNRRAGWTQEARVGGHKVYLRTGEYEDGTLGEIFIDLAKEGATLRGVLASFAIAVSKGLQYGVPLEEFVDSFVFQAFEPRGVVEGHPNIKMANSIIDYVFQVVGVEYLLRDELAQVPPDRSSMDLPAGLPPAAAEAAAAGAGGGRPVRPSGHSPVCSVCGHMTVRNGSCHVCLTCGETTGCS